MTVHYLDRRICNRSLGPSLPYLREAIWLFDDDCDRHVKIGNNLKRRILINLYSEMSFIHAFNTFDNLEPFSNVLSPIIITARRPSSFSWFCFARRRGCWRRKWTSAFIHYWRLLAVEIFLIWALFYIILGWTIQCPWRSNISVANQSRVCFDYVDLTVGWFRSYQITKDLTVLVMFEKWHFLLILCSWMYNISNSEILKPIRRSKAFSI